MSNDLSGWDLVGPRTILRGTVKNPTVFVQRSNMRGKPWLRFSSKFDEPGWYVTAGRTKREIVADFWPPSVGACDHERTVLVRFSVGDGAALTAPVCRDCAAVQFGWLWRDMGSLELNLGGGYPEGARLDLIEVSQ